MIFLRKTGYKYYNPYCDIYNLILVCILYLLKVDISKVHN
jgi:predicted Co/Zn/Cd cation transporter (cation efflux family)